MESCFQLSSVFGSCVGASRRFLIICLFHIGSGAGPTQNTEEKQVFLWRHEMTETNQKRFTGEGPTASEDYRRFKKWVQSHIFYKKVESETQGPFLYTLLDGEALAAVDELDFSSYAVKDGINILWHALDSRFPQKALIDSMGEALGEVFHLQANPGETMAAWTGRATQVFVDMSNEGKSRFHQMAPHASMWP